MGEAYQGEWVDPRFLFADPLPEANLFVGAAGDDEPAVGSEGDVELFAGGLAQGVEAQAGGNLPELDGGIAAGAGEHRTIGTEGYVVDGAVVSLDGTQQLAAAGFPYLDRTVVACGGEDSPIGRELGIEEDVAMLTGEFADELAGFYIPEERLSAQACDAGGGRDSLAIFREGDGVDLSGVSGERLLADLHRGETGYGPGAGRGEGQGGDGLFDVFGRCELRNVQRGEDRDIVFRALRARVDPGA